jgi:hypothetical protein
MQYVIDSRARPAAVFRIADVSLDEFEFAPLLRTDRPFNILEVMSIAGYEIIHPHHRLIELEQRFEKIGADKSGNPRDQPFFGRFAKFGPDIVKSAHNRCPHRLLSSLKLTAFACSLEFILGNYYPAGKLIDNNSFAIL